MKIHFTFAPGMDSAAQLHVKEVIANALQEGDILTCDCPTVDALVYETRVPEFQASISCSCQLMRPLFSSRPDTDD